RGRWRAARHRASAVRRALASRLRRSARALRSHHPSHQRPGRVDATRALGRARRRGYRSAAVTESIATLQSTSVRADVGTDRAAASRAARFRAIYEREAPYVWRTLRRLGVRARDLEDVTHDAFMAAYRRFDDYDAARAIRPWLFGFAFRLAADYRKR